MKKLITLLMILALGAGLSLQASKPIPSFKQNVSGTANFQEKNLGNSPNSDFGTKGKRNMIIVSNVIGPAKTPIYIWVYSLDMADILGPFIIEDGGGQISVPIDFREWGVIVQCADKVQVTVYTSDSGGASLGGGGQW